MASNTAAYLTVPEVAGLLRCRESKILSWIRTGKLAAINVSETSRPRYRVARSSLDAFLESRAVSPEPPSSRRPRRETYTRYV